jgi:hypothetical protein
MEILRFLVVYHCQTLISDVYVAVYSSYTEMVILRPRLAFSNGPN